MQQKLDPKLIRAHKGTSFVGVATCFICYDDSGRIFMALRSSNARDEQGVWDVGGGSLDWELTANDNALKEIQEEYTAVPLKIEFLDYRDVFRVLPDGRSTHWLSLDFAAKLDPVYVKINEPEKFDDSGWFTLDELPSPLHSQMTLMFKKYEAKLEQIFSIKIKYRLDLYFAIVTT